MTDMKQIARLAGVSVGTISHVLNDTAKVSERLRKRVLDVVQATEYQPNELARGLRRDRTNILAMMIPDIANPGYRLVLCNSDNDHAKEVLYLNALRTYLPAGLIMIPSSFDDLSAHTQSYRSAGSAVVCIDRVPRNWEGSSVIVDNVDGVYRATSYLIGLGHRHLAAITGPLHLTSAQDRLKGFKLALRHGGLKTTGNYMQQTTFDTAGGYAKTKEILHLLPRPTAIMACNDMIAFGALLAIREENLRCPEDISLIGFDGLDLTEITTPKLSSVYQSTYEIGATAVQLAIDGALDRNCQPRQVVLKTVLKIRESVAPPRAEHVARTSRKRTR
jgi:LacI family transcriptional regulator